MTCRVGSSENDDVDGLQTSAVTCRVGSSESFRFELVARRLVTCRVGSSETGQGERVGRVDVTCRVGSSEIAFPTFPLPAACGRDRRRNFDFFPTPLRGFRPCALRLPPSVAEQGQEGEPAKPGEPRQGCPGGSKGRPKGRTGGRHAPAPWGGRSPPFGGLLEGEGEPPEGWGNPLRGCPAKRPRSSEKRCIDRS